MALLLPVTRVVIPRFGSGGLPTAPAAVVIVDAQGNPAGYGPSNSPDGIFFGLTPFPYTPADVFWFSSVPAGFFPTPMAGGSWALTVALGTPPGVYPLGWTVQTPLGSRTFGSIPIQVT